MVNLLWDLDGTLVDSMPAIAGCLNKMVMHYGQKEWPLDELRPLIGPELGKIVAHLLALSDESEIALAKEVYRSYYRDLMLTSPPFPGIADALAHFNNLGCGQWVATAKYQLYAEQIVSAQGLRSTFKSVYGSEENGHLGNKSELLAHILWEEALQPAQTIMIGDTQYDMQGGRDNNMTTIGVLWGYGSEQSLKEAGAHFIVRTPAELPDVIKQATFCAC
jgi:phosphoglycolate phosphatase